jgi:DNA-binding Lrp family transcriptional regulator
MTQEPDSRDRALLEEIQSGVPLTGDIWDVIGATIGMTGTEVLRRLRRLQEGNVLRSIGPVIEPAEVGLEASSLIALRVPPERIEEVAAIINEYQEVSHNYRRDHLFNIWFTLSSRSGRDLEQVREEIRTRAGLENEDLLDLPRRRRFKIGVRFHILKGDPGEQP